MNELNANITKLTAREEIFNIELSDGECHLLRTGTCSLDKPLAKRKTRRENGVDYCQDLLKMMKAGETNPIIVGRAGCGHLEFCDGQHRSCIAQRKDLILDAIVEIYDELCSRCKPPVNISSEASEAEVIVNDLAVINIAKLPKPRTGFKFRLKK
jgi:hypothetical protein